MKKVVIQKLKTRKVSIDSTHFRLNSFCKPINMSTLTLLVKKLNLKFQIRVV